MNRVVILFLFFSVGFAAGTLMGNRYGEKQKKLKETAISLGHAQYNPTNANFEWKAVKP